MLSKKKTVYELKEKIKLLEDKIQYSVNNNDNEIR